MTVRPRSHGRSGASAAAKPKDPNPTVPSKSGPMQQAEARSPAINEPTRVLRSFTANYSLHFQIVARVALELRRALVAAGDVLVAANAHPRTVRVHGENDAADGALRELPSLGARLRQHVLGAVLELRGAREAAH